MFLEPLQIESPPQEPPAARVDALRHHVLLGLPRLRGPQPHRHRCGALLWDMPGQVQSIIVLFN